MTRADRKRSGVVTFPGAPTNEEEICAVLVTRDDAGNVHHFVRTGPERNAPDPEVSAMYAQAAELANI